MPPPAALRSARAINTLANGVILALAVFLGFHAVDSWHKVRAQETREMDSIALVMSRALDAYFLSKQEGLLSLADAMRRAPGGLDNLPEVQRLLVEYKQHRPELALAFVTDMSGQMLASSHIASLRNLPSVANQSTFQAFLRDYQGQPGIFIGRAQREPSTGEWSFALRLVVTSSPGLAPVVLNAVVPTDFLLTLWKDAPFTERMLIGLLRDDGYLLSRHPVPPTTEVSDLLTRPRTGTLMQYLREQGFPERGSVVGFTTAMPGIEVLNTFHRLPGFPLTVFVAQPTRQIVNAWFGLLLLPLLATALLGALIKLGARALVRREGQHEAQRMAEGAQLRRREAEQRELFDRLMTGLVVHDGTGAVLQANAEACRALGLTVEQMTGKALIDPAWQFILESGRPMPVEQYPVARVLSSRGPVNNWIVGIRKPQEPTTTWVICNAYPVFDDKSRIQQIVVSFLDITQMRHLTDELRDREARFKSLFDNSMDAVLMTAPDGRVLSANRAACALFRLSEAEICALGRTGLVDVNDPRLERLLRERASKGQVMGVLTMVRGDGSRFEAELSSSIYLDSQGHAYTSMMVRDITHRLAMQAALESANDNLRRANEQLAEMAHYDMLTHLPNRALLGDRLQQAISHATRRKRMVAVALLDLDGFKPINDRHGHAAGDQLLVQLAHRFRAGLRDGDTLARLGGDEFVLVMTDLADARDCEPLVERLLSLVAEPIALPDEVVTVSASVGVTIYPIDASDPEQLLRHADQAMYLAKQSGKNRFHLFDVASDIAVRERRDSLKAIQVGCERGEFVLHYQPQVNMRTGQVMGLEALVRWQHPERGLLAPGLFLPQVEDHDFAIEMGQMIIDLALRQMTAWQTLGLSLSVSINVFARQLQDAHFVDRLRQLLLRHPSVPPEQIELEIVETNALEDLAQVSELMRTCTDLGVRFALDDFGTGYSSLSYLKNLPAELLKIDQTFVRDMLEDRDDLAIVQGVIGLAHAFGRNVIAEGVETVEHGRQLLAMGCERGQGYGIARPMPADDVPHWLVLWKARQPWLPGADRTTAKGPQSQGAGSSG